MRKFEAYVIEVEPDICYKVCIFGVYEGTVSNVGVDDNVVTTFESALSSIVELMLGDDYEITFVKETRLGLRTQRCRGYIISVNHSD